MTECFASASRLWRQFACLALAVGSIPGQARADNGWDESNRGKPVELEGARLVHREDFNVMPLLRGPVLWAGQHADFGNSRFDPAGGSAYRQEEDALVLTAYRDAAGRHGGNVQSASFAQSYEGAPILPGRRGFACSGCYFETRMRFPRARGTWGGFWILSPDHPKDRGHLEVDAIEYYGLGDERGHHHAIHRWGPRESGGHVGFGDYTGMSELADFGWHRYGIDLRGKARLNGKPAVVITMDGLEVARIAAAPDFFTRPFYYLLSLTIGPEPDRADLPQSILVDYVEVRR